jgi:acyl phosphate:glycerol-3-phosphate acyltransferase
MGNSAGLLLVFFCLEFFLGSLMFSYWLAGRQGQDLKAVGDGNPGAVNLWRAAGWRWGVAGLLLDYLKGLLPLACIVYRGLFSGMELAMLAAAPVLGHAFSPFLGFSGGKAIAVTFGVWTALTLWVVPVLMGGTFALFSLVDRLRRQRPAPARDVLRISWGLAVVLAYLLWLGDRALLLFWVFSSGILGVKHQKEIKVLLEEHQQKKGGRKK